MAVTSRPCVRCRAMIPVERLEALPETRLCVQCSEAVGGEFVVKVRRVKLSKEGSLKKNYGDVEIDKVRRTIEPLDSQNT